MGIPIVYNVVYILSYLVYPCIAVPLRTTIYICENRSEICVHGDPGADTGDENKVKAGVKKLHVEFFPPALTFFAFVPSICLWVSEDEKVAFCDKFDWKTNQCSMHLLS